MGTGGFEKEADRANIVADTSYRLLGHFVFLVLRRDA